MSGPGNYLPPALGTDAISQLIVSLDLPIPTSIKPLQVIAGFILFI